MTFRISLVPFPVSSPWLSCLMSVVIPQWLVSAIGASSPMQRSQASCLSRKWFPSWWQQFGRSGWLCKIHCMFGETATHYDNNFIGKSSYLLNLFFVWCCSDSSFHSRGCSSIIGCAQGKWLDLTSKWWFLIPMHIFAFFRCCKMRGLSMMICETLGSRWSSCCYLWPKSSINFRQSSFPARRL
jgi:hypothetical protein